MGKDEKLKDVEVSNADINLQSEDMIAGGVMSDNNNKSYETLTASSATSDKTSINNQESEHNELSQESVNASVFNNQDFISNDSSNSGKDVSATSSNTEINEAETIEGNIPLSDTKLETNRTDGGGNFVPLLKDNGANCPPLQFRPRSSGAIYGAGYDAEIMQDNTRSLRSRKVKNIDDGLQEVDLKKPKPLWFKVTLIVLISIFSVVALFGVYLLHLESGFERIYDKKYLEVLDNNPANVTKAVSYEVVTYNMNYGAFSSDYTYYKSYGYNKNGKSTNGSRSRAQSKERVEVNTKGSAGLLSTGSNANAEFFMLQEIDVDSTRTYYVDERQILKDVFVNYAEIFAETGSSNYIFSPLTSPVGKYKSGMITYSAFEVDYAMRYSLPSNAEFPSKYGATDNCISVVKLLVAGAGETQYLVLINVNVSMYDSNDIREKDLQTLYEHIKSEVDRGNYVIVGGSFSYLLYGNEGSFENEMKAPDWCKELPECFNEVKLNEIGCRIVKDAIAIELKTGTTRDSSVKYKKGETFEAITDGFIVSSNIITDKIEVLDNEYLYSAHNPVRLTFKLK